MLSSDGKRKQSGDFSPPVLESLEPRLLLTTMQVPFGGGLTSFIYRGSEGGLVRVTLSNYGAPPDVDDWTGVFPYKDPVGTVELMRFDAGDVAQMGGLLDGVPVNGGLTGPTFALDLAFPLWGNPATVLALACDPVTGTIWAFDNNNSELWEVNPATGQPIGPAVYVVDSAQPLFEYDITAMEVSPTGVIYAVGTMTDPDPANPPVLPAPAGPFLLTIDPVTGLATPVDPTQTVVAAGNVNDIAFDPSSGTLYGTDGTNLLIIGIASGVAGPGPLPLVDVSNANAPITTMTGLEFADSTLYGQAGNLMYLIDPTTGDCTPLNGTLSQADMTDLASDGTTMYGVFSSNDETRLAIITLDPPSNADVFCVYIAEANEYTMLTFATITEDSDGVQPDIVQIFDAGGQPALSIADDAVGLRAPGNSGAVLVGGIPAAITGNPNQMIAAGTYRPYAYFASPLGTFPGGEIHAGIMTAGPIGEIVRYVEWDIDPGTGEPIQETDPITTLPTGELVILSVDPGLGTSVSALAADSLGAFFAVDNHTHMLMQGTYNPAGNPPATSAAVGMVVDSVDPSLAYTNIFALDFDSLDTLYGVATVARLVPGPPAPTGTYLITIDTTTGVVTRGAELNGATNITTIAFDSLDDLYGVDGDADQLVMIDTATGDVTEAVPGIGLTHDDDGSAVHVEGIAFDDVDVLWGVGEKLLYVIDPATGVATEVGEAGYDDLPALAFTSVYPNDLWSVTFWESAYRLVRLDPATPPQDMGRVLLGGTLAGEMDITGSLEILEVGFLYGNVDIHHDLGNLIVHTDAGGVPNPADGILTPEECVVRVGGTLDELDVYGTMYASVEATGLGAIPVPHDDMVDWNALPILELESEGPSGDDDRYVPWAEDGRLLTINNDTTGEAQFLFNASGNIVLWGTYWAEDGDVGNRVDRADYYAVSLMAGQTITIELAYGHISDPRLSFGMFGYIGVGLLDGELNLMGSYGWETVEDYGIGSYGTTLEPLVFTAPAAGVYYLVVEDYYEPEIAPGAGMSIDTAADYTYTMFVTNSTSATLGAVHVNADYAPAFTDVGLERNGHVVVKGGNLGAVQIDGYGNGLDIFVLGGGNAVAIRGGELGFSGPAPDDFAGGQVVCHGSIGLVESFAGDLNFTVVAGADGGMYNDNAGIQNVFSAARLFGGAGFEDPYLDEYLYGFSASGGIGSVFIGSHVDGFVEFRINSDNAGPAARLDLLDVRGDWGGLRTADPQISGVPFLIHGMNADIGMVHVTGTIYDLTGWTHPMTPVSFDDGTSSIVDDDGGGQIRISPGVLSNPDGTPVLVPDPTDPSGLRMMTVPSPYSYYVIPVHDPVTTGKVGGVLANLTMGGPGSISVVKPGDVADIGRLELTGPGNFAISGNGSISAYHVVGTDVTALRNTTSGVIASANFGTSVDTIELKGSLGGIIGSLDQWVWGYEPAPAGSYMGWFRGQINGLQVGGDITNLRVGGWLGDALITGRAENIAVNTDNLTLPEELGGRGFEGVVGVVHVGDLGQFNVGDGLADDGSSDVAMAAIISDAGIDRVTIDGAGRVLNGSVLAVTYIDQVTGRNGAVDTAIIGAMDLDSFLVYKGLTAHTGWIGTVDFSGPGAAIDGAAIYGQYILKISTSTNSDGIRTSYFHGNQPLINQLTIGQILAGGPGMYDCMIAAMGSIGPIRGVGSTGDLRENEIRASDSVTEISGRDLYANVIDVPLNIGRLAGTRDVYGNVEVSFGSLGTLSVGRDFAGNYFRVAAELKSGRIAGLFYESTLDFYGPYAVMGSMDVSGNISGAILSAGSIDSLISRAGVISADVETVANNTTGDIGYISAFGGYSGGLDVAGSVKKFYSYSSLGVDPSTLPSGTPRRFNIAGDLDFLTVKASRGSPPVHLYTALYVGGDIGRVDVDGSLYADLEVNGGLKSLTIDGDMGGWFDLGGGPVRLGNVRVLGAMKRFSMPAGASIVGDLTIGGSIGRITLRDRAGIPGTGDILGNITSLYGSVDGISLTNGMLVGNVTAAGSIGRISLRGTATDPANITGNLTAQGGGVAGITIKNGNLDADVTAMTGGLDRLDIRNGSALAGHTISVTGNIRSINIRNGDLRSDVIATGGLGRLNITGSDLTGNLTIGSDVGSISVSGDVIGSTIWVGGLLKSFRATNLTNATLASLYGMDRIDLKGNVTNSQIVGGYNAASAELHSARIKSVRVAGNWTSSVAAVGVDPVDGNFTTQADNTVAPGVSTFGKLDVRGGIFGAGNLVIADTSIDTTPAGMPAATAPLVPFVPPLGPPAQQFIAGTTVIGGVSFTLRGSGVGSFDPVANAIVLNGTTDRSSLKVNNPGAARQVTLIAGDDDSFSTLSFTGNLELGNTNLDGLVKRLTLGDAVAGAAWFLYGGVQTMATNGIANADIVMGELGTWRMSGGFLASSLTADAITRSMTIAGNLAAALTTTAGPVKALTVKGDVTGDVTADNGLGRFRSGNVSGDVTVVRGDLTQMQVTGNFTGNLDVQQGYLGRFDIRNGSFSDPSVDSALRALTGIGSFSISGGAARGLISTNGPIGRITARGGEFGSRVRAGRGIGSVTVDTLQGALLASGGDIGRVSVRGNMTDSDIVAGLDPADGGYDAGLGGEFANVRFDGRTPPAWRSLDNMDQLAGGSIRSVTIGGNMTASSIAAAVSPGPDKWFGTDDDQVRGAGYIYRASVRGYVTGSGNPTQHFGIYAASEMPKVSGSGLFWPVGNFEVGTLAASSGSPRVVDVQIPKAHEGNWIRIYFDHDIDISTINTGAIDPTQPNTLDLVVSRNSVFGPGEADDVNITDDVAHTISYDSVTHSITLRLSASGTWQALNKGTHFLLTIDGSVVTDRRGNLLDGEYSSVYPSGNGVPGGDFVYRLMCGDAGGTEATAAELTGDNPLLVLNQPLAIEGYIGDNPGGGDDIDVYMVDVSEGDVLYWFSPTYGLYTYYVYTYYTESVAGLLAPSLSSAYSGAFSPVGYRATADGSVYIWVESLFLPPQLEPYTLNVLLFNDGNSNFAFDDATQAATPLTWMGSVAKPGIDEQEISAPDDVDLFSLGVLPAYTELTLSLETVLIGSPLKAKMAVFNSTGDLVGNITFGDELIGDDIPSPAPQVTLTDTVLTPAADTYYVAVAGFGFEVDDSLLVFDTDFRLADMGKYRLTLSQQPGSAPVFPRQRVYLNFTGGVADFLNLYDDTIETYQEPFSATTFGFEHTDTQALLNAVVDTVNTIYTDPMLGAGLTNIEFWTVPPGGDFSTIFVGCNLGPEVGFIGLSEKIDTLNSDLADDAVVWGGEVATVYSAATGYTLNQIGKTLGNVAAHELGHILGLNHVQQTVMDNWLMGYGDWSGDRPLTTHASLMTTPNYEFLIGYQNSIASLWSVA